MFLPILDSVGRLADSVPILGDLLQYTGKTIGEKIKNARNRDKFKSHMKDALEEVNIMHSYVSSLKRWMEVADTTYQQEIASMGTQQVPSLPCHQGVTRPVHFSSGAFF